MLTMLESAEEDGVQLTLGTVRPANEPDAMTDIRALLTSLDLGLDGDIDLFVTARRPNGDLVGCLGLTRGGLLKCLGCSGDAQGDGVAAQLMQRMNYAALDRGYAHLFAFTKPGNRDIFESLGFYVLAEVPGVAIFLENTPFGLSTYLAKLRPHKRPGDVIGSIVLNANPFTLGHRYLVEQAAAASDVLHLFVVSEDVSRFPADVRLRLVREGVAELGLGDKIQVHAGGRYIVSRATFPNYFIADAAQRAHAAAAFDLQLFRNAIAPTLGITDRFVGTEPLSPVTNAYNVEMRHWLAEPSAGTGRPIRVHEIPRKELGVGVISASRVRANIDDRDLKAIERLVPKPTYDYIKTHFFAEN